MPIKMTVLTKTNCFIYHFFIRYKSTRNDQMVIIIFAVSLEGFFIAIHREPVISLIKQALCIYNAIIKIQIKVTLIICFVKQRNVNKRILYISIDKKRTLSKGILWKRSLNRFDMRCPFSQIFSFNTQSYFSFSTVERLKVGRTT